MAADVSEPEAMQEKIELLEEVQKAEVQFSVGLAFSSSVARASLLRNLKN